LATPFDDKSIDMLAALGLDSYKIPSGEITNLPYLRKIGSLGKSLLLSTGMSTLDEVGDALSVLESSGTPQSQITLLHCTTEYPAPFTEVNLRAMEAMRDAFPGIKGVGYSDHTVGIAVSLAAAALGAVVIEKHFTLSRTMEGPDHKASLEPDELCRMVTSIRNVELALGDGRKRPFPSELANRRIVRKSLVAARDITAGERLTENSVTAKRPGTGVSPMLIDCLMGRAAQAPLVEGAQIPFSWLE
jgi:sialic acid synthase SpsE